MEERYCMTMVYNPVSGSSTPCYSVVLKSEISVAKHHPVWPCISPTSFSSLVSLSWPLPFNKANLQYVPSTAKGLFLQMTASCAEIFDLVQSSCQTWIRSATTIMIGSVVFVLGRSWLLGSTRHVRSTLKGYLNTQLTRCMTDCQQVWLHLPTPKRLLD